MKKTYKKIQFNAGQSLESAVKQLKESKELVCGLFNDKMLYSDIDDLNSAFKKITGKTKAEFDKAERVRHKKYNACIPFVKF